MIPRRPLLLLGAVAGFLSAAGPAAALTTCGSLGQPACREAAPPGVELELSPAENPFGLVPMTQPPSPDRPLWPRVREHKPYGFNAVSAGRDGTTTEDEAHLHEQIGASLARVGADWAMIQYYPNLAAGGRPWDYTTYLDPKYRAYIRRGIRPVLTIMRTPRRFTARASTRKNSNVVGCGTSDACWNPPRVDADSAVAAFARDLVKRYPLAAGIEFWNEPNLSNPFWGGEPPNPVRYAALLDLVHDAVKSVRPNLPVLGGALANFASSSTDRYGYQKAAQRGYLAEMLRAGAAANMDAVAYHPYLGPYPDWTQDRAAQNDALYRSMLVNDEQVRNAYADAGVPIRERFVATEFGASTTDGWSEERRNAWLMLQYHLWDVNHPSLPLAARVDAAFIHEAVYDPSPAEARQAGFGLVSLKDSDGRFVPGQTYCSFRTSYGGFADCPAALSTPARGEAPAAVSPTSAVIRRQSSGRMRPSRLRRR